MILASLWEFSEIHSNKVKFFLFFFGGAGGEPNQKTNKPKTQTQQLNQETLLCHGITNSVHPYTESSTWVSSLLFQEGHDETWKSIEEDSKDYEMYIKNVFQF